MKRIFKQKIYIFLISGLTLIFALFLVTSKADSQKNFTEILVKIKNSEKIYSLKIDSNSNLDKIINEYRQNPAIEAVDYNNQFQITAFPNDPDYVYQKQLKQIKADYAWTWARRSEEVVIAIIDTGIDFNHLDLKSNIWINKDESTNDNIDNDLNGYIDDVYGWDFVNNNADNSVKISLNYNKYAVNHGTVVAGIIAATGNNNEGIAGVTWQSKLMSLRALDSQGNGNTYNVARAIDYAVKNNADIINLSFVGNKSDQILENSIKKAHRAGIIVVAAAGNEYTLGQDLDQNPKYPVCNDFGKNMIIGVGSVNDKNLISSFSNFGKNCIDIMAPGENIYSTQVYQPKLHNFKEKYGKNWSGTSFATPFVTGAIALIKSIDQSFSQEEILKLLKQGATDISFINFSRRKQIGSGLLNINDS